MGAISSFFGGSNFTLILLIVVLAVALTVRVLLSRTVGTRSKCAKCGAVFDSSRAYAFVRFGTWRRLKCPACGKTSFMAYSRESVTWPQQEKKTEQSGQRLSDKELEKQRMEDSKYERS